MVWYDECDSMRLYAMVWDSNAMLWDFNAMLWDFNAMLCYGVCCKRYTWTDCIWEKPDFTPERALNQADLARDGL